MALQRNAALLREHVTRAGHGVSCRHQFTDNELCFSNVVKTKANVSLISNRSKTWVVCKAIVIGKNALTDARNTFVRISMYFSRKRQYVCVI